MIRQRLLAIAGIFVSGAISCASHECSRRNLCKTVILHEIPTREILRNRIYFAGDRVREIALARADVTDACTTLQMRGIDLSRFLPAVAPREADQPYFVTFDEAVDAWCEQILLHEARRNPDATVDQLFHDQGSSPERLRASVDLLLRMDCLLSYDTWRLQPGNYGTNSNGSESKNCNFVVTPSILTINLWLDSYIKGYRRRRPVARPVKDTLDGIPEDAAWVYGNQPIRIQDMLIWLTD